MKKYYILFAYIVFTLNLSHAQQYSVSQVKQFYSARQDEFKLNNADLNDFVITDQYTDQHNGVTHIYMRQRVNGIEIFDANSNMHIDKNGRVVSINNSFVSNAKEKITSTSPSLSAQTALSNAATHVQMNVLTALSKTSEPLVNNQMTINEHSVSSEPIKIKLHYLTVGSELKMVYNVELYNDATNDWWNVRVDAQNGTVIEKNNWTVSCNFNNEAYSHGYSFSSIASPQPERILSVNKAMKSGNGSYNVLPLPYESPNHGNRALVNSLATPNASPFGWHDTDGVTGPEYTITRGNNVYAYEDTLNKNKPGYSPDGGSSLDFDYTYSLAASTESNLNSAITNLFFINNVVHDIYYNYGFTEAAGNYQANNYGKGGMQGDYVKAEAQDGGGTNNANFSAPVDGTSGKMQMYLWPLSSSGSFKGNSPSTIAGTYNAVLASFGPKIFPDITQNVVLMQDSNTTPQTYYGCGALQNRSALAGNIALVDRNTSLCTYTTKVLNAQNSGAVAVIVIQSSSGTPFTMTGASTGITIPSFMISLADGNKLKSALASGNVNITIKGNSGAILDGDLDNGVIAHESGHGVSIRLTGGPSNSSCLTNAEQAGEGWSDFFALAFTAKAGDKGEDGRGIGTFVFNQPIAGTGIRAYKYSRNMSIDPMTYDYIKTNTEIHYTGTVWCSVLWDLYWNMSDKYGWDANVYSGTGGNNKTIQLVIDGFKLQRCNPGFLDSRDAILLADSIDNGGANKALIWKTFARRGMGYSAYEGSTNSATDGAEAFDLPPGITGIKDLGIAEAIKVTPNPTNGMVFVMLPSYIEKADISVIDIAGKVVMNGNMRAGATNRVQFDLSNLNNGIYFISVNSGDRLFQSKIVLTK